MTDWLKWLIDHEGEMEWTGTKPTDFVKYVFTKTNFGPLRGVTPPACAATICAALEDTGMKSPRSAAAKDFLKYGQECNEPKVGAIAVMSFVPGHFHVTCIRRVVNDELIDCLGGNQAGKLQTVTYYRKSIKALRWPVKC